jgi:nucleoside phosphorylase
MGKSHAGRAVSDALQEYDAGLMVCLGIAGSLSDDLRLGDVCYSGAIIDVYDNARAADSEGGELDLSFSPTYFNTPREVTAALNFIRTFPELKEAYTDWQRERAHAARSLISDPLPGRNKRPETFSEPVTKSGTIVCASVSKSEKYNTKLRAVDRKVLAIETESGGVFEEAARRGVPALTVRGISDHADAGKGALESTTGGLVRRVAASNAASFLRLQTGNPHFQSVLNRRRGNLQIGLPLGGPQPKPPRDLAAVVADIGSSVDEKLRDLSPEFRLQEKGYRLPIPRMRQVHFTSGMGQTFKADPLEIREALEGRDVILLTLPRNYPDYSLPWVLANDLLTAEVSGQQVIPVIIDGQAVRPPRADLVAAAEYPFDEAAGRPGVRIVFLVDEIPLASKTRTAFLEGEVRKNPDAKFVFITRNETHIVAESDFTRAVAADVFQLSGVSFLEIAHFVQKNFGMTGSEAEVIALRLRDTFRSFDLSAHPTYFAGISREIVSALLQANRRAELIQLAVDGFLTFVVAGDTANVTLSRTTRARFLRRLVVETTLKSGCSIKNSLSHSRARFHKNTISGSTR